MIFSPELSTAANLPLKAGWIERTFIRLTSMGFETRRIDAVRGLKNPVARIEKGLPFHGFDVADVRHGDLIPRRVRNGGDAALTGFDKALDLPDLVRDLMASDQDEFFPLCSDPLDLNIHSLYPGSL